MIKVELSVREAMAMVSLGCGIDMYEKIVVAFEKALLRELTTLGCEGCLS